MGRRLWGVGAGKVDMRKGGNKEKRGDAGGMRWREARRLDDSDRMGDGVGNWVLSSSEVTSSVPGCGRHKNHPFETLCVCTHKKQSIR